MDFRDCGRLAKERLLDRGLAKGCRNQPGVCRGGRQRAASFTPCSNHCAVPAWLPLSWSLFVPQQPVHSLFSDLPGAVNILTFQLPTCHHPSQAIRVTVQGFPPGSGTNGEQKRAARGSRPQGRHMGEEVTRGHCHSAHTAQVGRLKTREQEGLTRVLIASSYCLHSGLPRTLSNFLTWKPSLCSQTSRLHRTKGGQSPLLPGAAIK